MVYRNENYTSFYVEEPFVPRSVRMNKQPDFIYYNQLKLFKKQDNNFPFVDVHYNNYNVRDASYWGVLKPRIRTRLQKSKNIILFLSHATKQSRTLREEIEYGVNNQELPIIVIYPDYQTEASLLNHKDLKQEIKNLWNLLPIFQRLKHKVPTLHIPMDKETISKALQNEQFMISTKREKDLYVYA